jgi:predicted phage terminase large subunit-like protein
MKKIPSQKIIDKITKDRSVRTAITRASHEWFFTVYLSHYVKNQSAPFHEELFVLTEDPDWKLLCVVAFRGSGKSTIFTTSYALWSTLGKQQKKFVLIFCQTMGQAKLHMMNLRQELEGNALLKDDLGPFQEEHDEWGSSSLVFSRTNARITVASTEQSIRGLRHQEHRPDLIICDDVEDLASTKTQEGRDKTHRWFTSEVIPAGDINTRIVVVGNLLHEDSLLMRLKSDIDTGKRKGEFRAYPLVDTDGIVSWTGKYPTLESIEEQKQTIGNESAWQREYLLRIITDEDQVVLPEWIKYYDILPSDSLSSDFRFATTGIDLAISEKVTADYTAMVSVKIFGRGRDLRIYILPNPINERLSFPMATERARKLSLSLGGGVYTKLYIENVGYQGSFIEHLQSENVPAEEFRTQGQDKRARLTLTTNLIQSGKILFPRQGAELLVKQLVGFGKERHDDLADAFSIVILKAISANTQEFFPEWRKEIHIVEPITIPDRWIRFRSISFGLNGYVCCHWFAVDISGTVWIYKEYYESGKDHAKHAKAIAKLSEIVEDVQDKYLLTLLDASAFGPQGIGESAFDIYANEGIVGTTSGHDPEMKWNSIRHYLGFNKAGEPKLKVFNTSKHFIQTIPLLTPDVNNRKDVEKGTDTAAVDDAGYLLQYLRDQGTPKPETPAQKRMRELGLNNMSGIDPDEFESTP